MRKISCRLNINEFNNVEGEQSSFAKVNFGGDKVSIGRTFKLTFSLTI